MSIFARFAQSTFAARVCCIVLLAALAGLATDAVLNLAYSPLSAAPTAQPLGASAQPPLPSLLTAAPAWLASGDAPAGAPSSSELKLLGVVAQGASGYALIQQEGKRAQVLRVGQKLADGTQLKSVSGKSAVLLVNNEIQTLYLPQPTAGGALPLAVNSGAQFSNQSPNPISFSAPVLDSAAQSPQQAQQIQQLQQAAAPEGQAVQPNADSVTGSKSRRLGGRP